MDNYYYMATEKLECKLCNKKYAALSADIMAQLSLSERDLFPAIMTNRLDSTISNDVELAQLCCKLIFEISHSLALSLFLLF